MQYIGYETSAALSIVSPDEPTSNYGLWFLLQLPPDGTLAFAVCGEPELIDIYESDIIRQCRFQNGCVLVPIDGKARHKLGISSKNATGRCAYLRSTDGDRGTLIVRQATIFPGGLYADFPGGERERRDIAVQAYNDGGEYGSYGEMEYHAVAASRENGFLARDVSRTWCFAGSMAELRHIAERLLGCSGE